MMALATRSRARAISSHVDHSGVACTPRENVPEPPRAKRGLSASISAYFHPIAGNAADPEIIAAANLGAARCLLVAIPDAFEGGQVVRQARAINPTLPIIARAHSEEEIDHLKRHGADIVVMSEHEIAKSMLINIAEAAPKRAKPRRRTRSD